MMEESEEENSYRRIMRKHFWKDLERKMFFNKIYFNPVIQIQWNIPGLKWENIFYQFFNSSALAQGSTLKRLQ